MAKSKYTKECTETNNRSVYNKARKHVLKNTAKISCAYCYYHCGDNSRNHYYAFTTEVVENIHAAKYNFLLGNQR